MAAAGAGFVATPTPGAASKAKAAAALYYVNLGDSLAQGYQPGRANRSETLHGYANRVVTDIAPKHELTLENFGCGGDTTEQILYSLGCAPGNLAKDGVGYPATTQAEAAVDFIDAHPGRIGLITITIGGNDLGIVPLGTMEANIAILAVQLRRAAGAKVPIIALGYDDPTLAYWLYGSAGQAIARKSVVQIRQSFNPAFEKAYAPSKVTFLNIAAAFGTFVTLSKVVTLAPYGRIPFAVAQICRLTWICQKDNEHPTNAGYALMAEQIVRAYLKLVA
jgi:lysophospholipase L1-like esterase